MGWYTLQLKMLLFCAKTIVKESQNFELACIQPVVLPERVLDAEDMCCVRQMLPVGSHSYTHDKYTLIGLVVVVYVKHF